MYQALYRKYRPNNFNEIAGQQVIVKTLKNAIKNDRLSHAYLFTGPRGTGKTSVAKIVAKTINCECLNDFVPCDKCKSCLQFNSKNNVDIIEIDAASNNGVDEIREIRNKVDLVPSFSKYKVYIIDEVHMLTQGAFNALLKTLEEPPRHIVFILATTEPHKIPNTILSRCQRFDFKRLSNENIVDRLKYISSNESIDINENVLFEIAYLSDGGLRDSISLLDQVVSYVDGEISLNDVHEVNGTVCNEQIKKIAEAIFNHDYEFVFSRMSEYNVSGKNLVKIVESLIVFIKNVLMFYEAPSYLQKNNFIHCDYNDYNISTSYLVKCINVFNECLINMRKSNNPLLLFELSMLSISDLNDNDFINKNDNKNDKKCDSDKNASFIHNIKISEFKQLRVDNTLACFNKSLLRKNLELLVNVKNYIIDDRYGKYASLLLDGVLKASSEEYLIFVYESNDFSNNFNENFVIIEELLEKVLLKKYKVVSVSLDEWDNIKNIYNSKMKKYEYKSEGNMFYAGLEKKSLNDEIADMFSDIIEYK